jgi:hypothetical protein
MGCGVGFYIRTDAKSGYTPLIHILVRHLMRNSDASIRSPAALGLSYGVPAEVAPYLKVRMKLSTPEFIDCAGGKYDRQVDRRGKASGVWRTTQAAGSLGWSVFQQKFGQLLGLIDH